MSDDATLDRLNDQITWYDERSGYCQRMFKWLKVALIVVAASIPLAAGIGAPGWVTGLCGVLVVILEGVQQLNQYQNNWTSYRSTCESLKHEKYLFAATAGPYANATNARALLAERIEGLVSQEHAKWISAQQESTKPKGLSQ